MNATEKFTYVTLCIAAALAGFVAYFFLFTPGTFTQLTTKITSQIQPLLNTWNSIPGNLQQIIIAGIPTAFMFFFAWTKTRAMAKLDEVKQQAAQQITQLQGEKREAQQQLATSATQGFQNLIDERNAAITSRDEAQSLVTQLQQKLNTLEQSHLAEVARLQNQIAELKLKEVQIVK